MIQCYNHDDTARLTELPKAKVLLERFESTNLEEIFNGNKQPTGSRYNTISHI